MSYSQYKTYKLVPYEEVVGTLETRRDPGINSTMIKKFGKEIELRWLNYQSCYECMDGWMWHEKWVKEIIEIIEIKEFNNLIEYIQCL